MKIESLEAINDMPMASSDVEVDDRVCSVLEFYSSNSALPVELVAEAIVDAMGNICYSESMSESTEYKVLAWVTDTFDQDNESYLDALATIYANMQSPKAFQDLTNRINSVKNNVAKKLLQEAVDEFEPKT